MFGLVIGSWVWMVIKLVLDWNWKLVYYKCECHYVQRQYQKFKATMNWNDLHYSVYGSVNVSHINQLCGFPKI